MSSNARLVLVAAHLALPLCPLLGCTDDAPRDISGSYVRHFVTETGVVDVPLDLSTYDIGAEKPPFDTLISGYGQSDGTFEVPDVPAGYAYVNVGSLVVLTDGDEIDLEYNRLGRPTATTAASGTTISLTLDNLAPWKDGDELQMFSANNALYGGHLEEETPASAPAVGATQLSSYPYRMQDASRVARIEATAGDRAFVTQLTTVPPGYQAVERAAMLPSFSTVDGSSVVVQAALEEPVQTSVDVTWDRASFDAAIAAVAQGSASVYSSLYVHTMPDAKTRGWYGVSADLLSYGTASGDTSALSTSGWSFRDPYPAAWTRMLSSFYEREWSASPGSVAIGMVADYPLDGAPSMLVPTVTPVRDVTLDGQPAAVKASTTGHVPALAWKAPATGTIAFYLVVVYQLDSSGARTYVAEIRTNTTSTAVPPWMLTSGSSFVFQVRAIASLALPSGYSYVDVGPVHY